MWSQVGARPKRLRAILNNDSRAPPGSLHTKSPGLKSRPVVGLNFDRGSRALEPLYVPRELTTRVASITHDCHDDDRSNSSPGRQLSRVAAACGFTTPIWSW